MESGDGDCQAPGARAKPGQAPEEEGGLGHDSQNSPQDHRKTKKENQPLRPRSRAVLQLLRRCAPMLLWSLSSCSSSSSKSRHDAVAADLVFRHGGVYTVDAARSWASAVAIAGGRITYVG